MSSETVRGRVLLVEDDQDLHETLVSILGDRYETFEAANGAEALSIVDKFPIDVIVMDEHMPVMGGHECFSILRKRTISIPVIFCTGKPLEEFKKRELNLGAFDYIAKPFNVESLNQLVDEAYQATLRIQAILKRPKLIS